MRTALVAVAGGRTYQDYALRLMETARRYFKPTDQVDYIILDGEHGWPQGTATRPRTLRDALPRAHYVYLIDADSTVVAPVGPEILPGEHGITATMHPGYISRPPEQLPFEDREDSPAYVPVEQRQVYYCGGFWGGERLAVKILCAQIDAIINRHRSVLGDWPRWHDESALNAVLAHYPPAVTLTPSYTYPDDDRWYRTVWPEQYERRIVALDKPAEARVGR